MKSITYRVLVQWFVHGKRASSYLIRTKAYIVQAPDILQACDIAKAKRPGSEVSMVWPLFPQPVV